jgi:hypothetical protein
MDKIILKEGNVIDLSKLKKNLNCITKIPSKFINDTVSDELIWETIVFNKLYNFNFDDDIKHNIKKDIIRILKNRKIQVNDNILFKSLEEIIPNFKPETFIIPKDRKFIVLEREFIEDIEALNSALSYSNSDADYIYNPALPFEFSSYYRTMPKKCDYIIKTKILNEDGTYNKNNSIVMFWDEQLIKDNEGIIILENRTRCYE